MADTTGNDGNDSGSHWLRWLVLIALALAAIVAGRSVVLRKSDQEFEQRLIEADRRRN